MLPKSYKDNIKLRHQAIGDERRRNMCKLVLEHAPTFPLGVQYKDIDEAVQEWVDKELYIVFDGKKLPTFKLFSNQRINEYAQSWQHLDETGNLLMNFKTITRENNPQQGKNQGGFYNIPGNRDYPVFMVPVLQENGQHAYDMYSMKQPFSVDMTYSITLVTNKYELINNVNQMIHDKFKSLECYIAPNYHYMPMTLDSISDESEYSLDDRKYYSQTYKILVKAYIIQESDFKVTRLPSRAVVRLLGTSDKKKKKINIQIEEEDYIADPCCLREENDPYYNKKLTLVINFSQCEKLAKFDIDCDMIIRQVQTNNVYDFLLFLNGEVMDFENEVRIYNGDTVEVEISRDDELKDASVIFDGFDPTVILDERYNPESSLDDEINEEIINYNA